MRIKGSDPLKVDSDPNVGLQVSPFVQAGGLSRSHLPPMPFSTDTPRSRLGRVERFETVVIGGGQAGLAVGHYLASDDADFVILDGASRIGDSWRRRWDSLRLFTPAAYSGLPGMPFPAPPTHLPDKDEVADYLARYAERFDLPVRARTRVDTLSWDGARHVVRANGAR